MLVQKAFCLKNKGPQSFYVQKMLTPQRFSVQKIQGEKIWLKNIQVKRLFDPNIILVKRSFVQKKCWFTKIKAPKKCGPKILVVSISADILLIWRNVAWAYIAWTNVTVTVGI